MLQLKVLSGKSAGLILNTRRFPVGIGRASKADLRLQEEGVWDEHLVIDFDPANGVVLAARPGALAQVNGEPVEQARLRSGDIIQLGAVNLQFWLAENRQAGLGLREAASWALILGVCFAQMALLYWLLE